MSSYRDFSQNNINLFKNNLSIINWDSLHSLTVADDVFNSFWDSFNIVFNSFSSFHKKKSIKIFTNFSILCLLAFRQTK